MLLLWHQSFVLLIEHPQVLRTVSLDIYTQKTLSQLHIKTANQNIS